MPPSSEQARQIGERFRQEREELSRLVDQAASPQVDFAVFETRASRIRPPGERRQELERGNRLTRSLPEIASSFAHMHLNRPLPARHQEHELVIYEFLVRLYEQPCVDRHPEAGVPPA
jgi:hypothetical protein